MKKGIFISFEGGEGVGKTTQKELLKKTLVEMGYSVVVTDDPGGTTIGSHIRGIVTNKEFKELDSRTELFLYLAGRAQLVNQKIKPALIEGKIVITDRFHHSTLAYQGGARSLDKDFINKMNFFATDGILPDITFLLDLPPKLGFERMLPKNNKGKSMPVRQPSLSLNLNDSDMPRIHIDRIEREGLNFHERVRKTFLELAEEESERIVLIDAKKPIDEIASLIKNRVLSLINKKNSSS